MTGTDELTPAELVDDCLARIAARDGQVEAWEVVAADTARADAARADLVGPLAGVPVGIKDIVDVAGLPTGCGSPVRHDHVATADAECVRRLRAAGAIVLGKTVTTEFAYSHPARTRNPHALDHTPGGSSSGSAAAVADRMVPCAIGSQTAGSTVRPASYCGIVGFVPTFGRIPLDGVQHLAPALDRLGLFTRTVAEVGALYAALTEESVDTQPRRPPRVFVTDEAAIHDLEPAMRETVHRVAERVAALGVPVESFGDGGLEREWARAQTVVMAHDAARALADVAATHRAELSATLLDLVDTGAAIPDADFSAALEVAAEGRRVLDERLTEGAVVLTPAATGPAPRGLSSTGSPAANRPWHLLGVPELAVPAGDVDGLPLGVQLVGPHGADAALLDTAAWLEQALS